MIAVSFVLAAFTGAIVRGLITDLDAPFDRQMWGTLGVNVSGAFLLGLLHETSANTLLVAGVAGLGSLTTFSTFIAQVECIGREGRRRDAILYLFGSVILGIAAGWVGWSLA